MPSFRVVELKNFLQVSQASFHNLKFYPNPPGYGNRILSEPFASHLYRFENFRMPSDHIVGSEIRPRFTGLNFFQIHQAMFREAEFLLSPSQATFYKF
jgi:hypothetical protein